MPDDADIARLVVKTQGVWRTGQLVEAMTALDGLTGRVRAASLLAQYLEEKSYVTSNLRALGLMGKELEDWGQAPGGLAGQSRSEYVEFVTEMRRAGVEVLRRGDSVVYEFSVADLLDLVAPAYRLEIEQISMSSPGVWSFVMTGMSAVPRAIPLLKNLFDALFFRREALAARQADVRSKRAQARREEARARREEARTKVVEARAVVAQTQAVLDYSGVLFELVEGLRTAGFPESGISTMVASPIQRDIDILARYRASGQIEQVSLEPAALSRPTRPKRERSSP